MISPQQIRHGGVESKHPDCEDLLTAESCRSAEKPTQLAPGYRMGKAGVEASVAAISLSFAEILAALMA